MASTGRSRRLRLLVVVVALAAAGGVGAWWWTERSPPEDAADEDTVDEPDVGGQLERIEELLDDPRGYDEDRETADDAVARLAALGGDDDVEAATAPGTLDEVTGDLAGALPDGAVVTPESETWSRQGNLAVIVVGVDLDGADEADHFLVWLVRDTEQDGWLISHTERLDDEAPS